MSYITVFKKALKFYGGSEEFDDFRYVGGANEQHNTYFLKLKSKLDSLSNCKIYEAEFPINEYGGKKIKIENGEIVFLPPVESQTKKDDDHNCLCGHNISYLMYIQNIKGGDILVVGSCCITKFFPKEENKIKGTKRRCTRCNDFWGGRKHFECEKCRKEIKQMNIAKLNEFKKELREIEYKLIPFRKIGNWTVYFNKYKGKEVKYFELVENDIGYCKYLVKNVAIKEEIKNYLTYAIDEIEIKKKIKDFISNNNI